MIEREGDFEKLPLVVLGGSDRAPAQLPASGASKHPLVGYKGAEVRFGGRALIELLVERVRECGGFGPCHVVGPAAVYAPLGLDATLIDADGTFGENIEAAVAAVRRGHPGCPIAFLTCDVLPGAETLRRQLDLFERSWPCDFWFAMVRAPREASRLGASEWKPVYRLIPGDGSEAVRVLPGHLVIVDPEALRLRFMYRLFQQAYRSRNRAIETRRRALLRGLVLELLLEDLVRVLSLRLPDVTFSVLGAGLPAVARLRRGTLSVTALENALRRIFVGLEHRRCYPERRVVIPLVDELELATDIDTEEEVREHGGEVVTLTARR